MSEFFQGDAIKVSRYWAKFDALRNYEQRTGSKLLILKGDMMLVEKLPPVEIVLKSGLVYAESLTHRGQMADDATEFGLVLATGPGQYFDDGTIQPCDSKPGDVVLLPGNVNWYSQFAHIKDYKSYSIGRLRDSQVPVWLTDYRKCFDILNNGDEPRPEDQVVS